MAISPYVARLRTHIGQDLLLLPSVTVLVENERNELLLVRHVGFDRWGTIGGMVEPREHPRDAAVREVQEETGFAIGLTALVTVAGGPDYTVTYPNGDQASYVTSVFAATLIGGSETLDAEELTAIGWFNRQALQRLELDPFATALFTDLGYLTTDNSFDGTSNANDNE